MKQEVCILPVRCEECSALFDLWYDLHAQEQGEMAVVSMRQERAMMKETLCWRCRQAALEEVDKTSVEDLLELEYE